MFESTPHVAKKWLDSNALALFVPTLHGKDLICPRTIDFGSPPSLHLGGKVGVILDDMTEGSMRQTEQYSSEVISCSTFHGHLKLLPAQGLVKEDT